MKKTALIFTLLSICTLVSAQEIRKGEETQNATQGAFYIYSPSSNLVLEVGYSRASASPVLRFNKLQRGNTNQLFVIDKYYGDWNRIYNLKTKKYFTTNRNQVGLGDRENSEKVKISNGNFYVEYRGVDRKLMVSQFERSRGAQGAGSRGDIQRKAFPTLNVDVSNRSRRDNNYFELFRARQYAELLAKTEKGASSVSPPPRTTPKPTISNVVFPHSNKSISQNYTSISAIIGNVSRKESIQLTLNGRNIPFTYRDRRLSTSKIVLTPGNNNIKIFVRNASGTQTITRVVYYNKPKPVPVKPATGLVAIKLNSSSNCGSYSVILENLDDKNKRFEFWLDRNCKAAKEVPTGRYRVQFNLLYTDGACDQCENPAKIKRVNTNCSSTIINLGKNKTANLSCYKNAK